MSFTNLHTYPADGCQRVSYRRSSVAMRRHRDGANEEDNASGDGIIISKNLIIGCKPEECDDFRPFIFEPTWCVYIKAQDNIDMGRYVKRVTFRMSPRLPLRLHVADGSPFEITEVLSTDFPLELQVDFLDGSMSPTTYAYKPNDVFDGKYNVDLRMSFRGHERRDKMFFMNPSPAMQLTLMTPAAPSSSLPKLTPCRLPPRRLPPSLPKAVEEPAKTQQQPAQPEEPPALKSPETSATSLSPPTVPRPIFNVRLRP